MRTTALGALAWLGSGCFAFSPPTQVDADRDAIPEEAPPTEVKSATGSEAHESAKPEDTRPAVTAVVGYEKIRLKPVWNAPIIGLIRAGQSVPLKSTNEVTGYQSSPCKGGWYEVEPRGYVCVGKASRLHREDPRAIMAQEVLPDLSGDYPYKVGTMAADSPLYTRIPTRAEQREHEKELAKHLKNLPEPHEVYGSIVRKKAGIGPSKVFQEYAHFTRKQKLIAEEEAYQGRKIAWAKEFDAEGRTWLLTPDLTLVPKDKVYVGPQPKLRGVDLRKDKDFQLPLAYTWLGAVQKYEKDADGTVVETTSSWPRHAFVPVEGRQILNKGVVYWPTRDGHYVRHTDITVIKKRNHRPPGVGKNDKWIHVRITWGFLVAYEGDTPVFATAISPGADGVTARAGGHNTARGRHTVGWKLFSGDMDGYENRTAWAVDEVPYVAYYKDSYALHGAWWHDDFGRPKSHGCINMSPADARFVWDWMDPGMPEGWYAVTAMYPSVKGTVVDVGP